jgi:D-alanine-D-alanine ligase-like ATP-grasp enzyme
VKELLEMIQLTTDRSISRQVLAEEFIDGREFYVGVLGNSNVQACRSSSSISRSFQRIFRRLRSWAAKWGDDGDEKGAEFAGTESVFPTDLSEELSERIKKVAIDAFQHCGSAITRVSIYA